MADELKPKKPKELPNQGGVTILPSIDLLDSSYYVSVFEEFFVPPTAEQKPFYVASNLTGLNSISISDRDDGDVGLIRLGSWPNTHEEYFSYRADVNKWVGETKLVISQLDRWSMDLGDKVQSTLASQWNFFSHPNPNGCDAYTLLNGTHDFNSAAFNGGTGVINVKTGTNLGTGNFPTQGVCYVWNNRISYTGKTSSTLTGCTRTFPVSAGTTALDNSDVTLGPQGGWGTISTPVAFAQEMQQAGFSIQERMSAHMSPSSETPRRVMEIAAYWVPYNDSDGVIAIADPPTGGLGFSNSLFSGSTQTKDKPQERDFFVRQNDWTDFPAMTFTKRYMQPRLYGRMASGANDTGQVLDCKLLVRWVGGG